jgi:hypothetical protein
MGPSSNALIDRDVDRYITTPPLLTSISHLIYTEQMSEYNQIMLDELQGFLVALAISVIITLSIVGYKSKGKTMKKHKKSESKKVLNGFFLDDEGELRRGIATWVMGENNEEIPVYLEYGSNKVYPRKEDKQES